MTEQRGDFGEFELLRKLTQTPGVSGREERVRDLILTETAGLWDQTRVDSMGNLICLKRATLGPKRRRGRSETVRRAPAAAPVPSTSPAATLTAEQAPESPVPRVMLACHMDEIGFYVRYIDENGFLRLQSAGGFDARNLFARRVLVQGKEDLVGILNPATKPVHLASEEDKKKIPEMREFFVDLFRTKRQVKRLVDVGDPVTLIQHTEVLGDAITGKAMDNRVAVWTAVSALRRAATKLRYDTYFVACVQEEVGLRGSAPAAFGIDPHIGIAIDSTLCCDTPGTSKDDAVTEFGRGVAIKVMDSASISHRGLFDEFVSLAQRNKIPFQREVLPRGGTDAGAVQRVRAGTKAITISVPTRYVHTVTEAIHKKDARAAVDLLAAWLITEPARK
jgi:putative aminopeptidase FrvX